jgi:hypothetical protein
VLPGIGGSILGPIANQAADKNEFPIAFFSQLQFHVDRALDRICTVGRNLIESQPAIHRYRIFHDGFDGIQTHAPVADVASLGDDRFRQSMAQALTAKLRAKIKALHFAGIRFQLVQRHASRQLAFIFCHQQAAIRRGIATGKSGEFLVEVLEAKAEAERFSVLEEKLSRLRDLSMRFRLHNRETRDRTRYPISIPPFTLSTWPLM